MFDSSEIMLIDLSNFKIDPSIARLAGMFNNCRMRPLITDKYIKKEYSNR